LYSQGCCRLERELDTGEDAAGAGFLPGEIDAVDDGERGNDGDDPEHGPHAVEKAADDEKNEALGTLHEADFAQGDEGFGAGARIADHDGAGSGDGGQNNVGSAAAYGVVDEQAHVQGHVRVAIERRIVEGAESGDAVLAPRHLPVQNVQETGEENNQGAGEESAHGEESGGAKIHDQAKKGEEIGIDSRGGDYANDFVEQPFAAGSNSPG
jgi:hypothetical protein